MENNALITVRSIQQFMDNPPEYIDLTSEGRIWEEDGILHLSYMESALTGLEGTETVFSLEGDCVVLERRGTVTSRMEFRCGEFYKSMYHSADIGTLLITVGTTQIENNLELSGGMLRVLYSIDIEDAGQGTVAYEITVVRR